MIDVGAERFKVYKEQEEEEKEEEEEEELRVCRHVRSCSILLL